MAEKVAEMTIEELKRLIRREVALTMQQRQPRDPASVRENLELLKKNRWTPPPGTPTTEELVREDQDK